MRRRRGGPGLIGAAARTAVVVGTAGAVSHRQQGRYAAKEQAAADAAAAQAQAAAPSPAAPAAPAAEEQPSYVAELEELARLRDAGILTPRSSREKARSWPLSPRGVGGGGPSRKGPDP